MMNRRYIHASTLLLVAVVFIGVPRASGYPNPIEGGSTVTVTNDWTVPGGDLYVGQTTSNNSLILSNGDVYNTHAFIGSHAGSSNNLVSVEYKNRAGVSTWHNAEALYLGGHRKGGNWVNGGSGNALDVEFGCWVFVGEMNTNTPYNLSASIAVGDASGTPEMVIANGSAVQSRGECYIGYGTNESGSVEIRGEGSIWKAGFTGGEDRPLYIGYYGSGNRLTVSGGGLLDAPSAFLGYDTSSDNNVVLVTGQGSRWDGAIIHVGYSGTGNRVEISDGGQMASGYAILGHKSDSDNNSVLVTGTGSGWKATWRIEVGVHGKGNTLTISDGGDVWALGSVVSVGRDSGSDDNAVFVSGIDSTVSCDSFYLGGEWNVGGRGNGLYVNDGGLVSIGASLHNRNYSMVAVDDSGSQIVIGEGYYQDATSILRLGITSNRADTAFLSVQGSAAFEAGATLQYQGVEAGILGFDHFTTNLLVEADTLIVGGVTNATDLGDLEVVNLDSSLVEMELLGLDQNMYGLLSRRHLAESAGFDPGSQLALVSGEIDDLSVQGNAMAVDQINLLNGMSASQQNAQLTQRYAQGAPSYRHNQTLVGGRNQVLSQSRQFQSSARSLAAAPSGPAGPHKEGQALRGWIQGYGGWSDYEGTATYSGFDQSMYGTIIGFDQAFGNVLLGAAGGYAQSDLTQDNQDRSDATTGYGVLYASVGAVDWFGDLLVSYGQSDIETQSGTQLGGSGNFTADNFACYFGGGKEIRSSGNDGLAFIPEAALMAGYYGQPEYVDGLMQVDAYDRWSVQSRIGAALRMERKLGSVIVTPEFRTYWLHEFNADPDQVGYSLTGGSGSYSFGVQAPVEDLLEVGLGLGIAFNDRLELVFDVDSQISELYQALNASGRLSYEF